MTAVDIASRWLIAAPIRNGTAKSVWKFVLEEIVLQYGKPEFVLSDNGKCFDCNYFRTRCADLDIKPHFTPKYNPSANQVERHHRSINTSLAIFAKETHRTWDDHLPYVIFALRNAVSDATGFSPAKLTFGENLRMPFDLNSDIGDGDLSEFQPDVYNDHFENEQMEVFQKAIDSVEKAKQKNAQRYNLRRRPSSFNVGELVWYLNHDKSSGADRVISKFLPKFKGPCVIAEIYSPSQVRLETLNGANLGRWNVAQLKHVI